MVINSAAEHLPEDQLKLVEGVYFGCFAQGFVPARFLGDLIEKKLIRFGDLLQPVVVKLQFFIGLVSRTGFTLFVTPVLVRL